MAVLAYIEPVLDPLGDPWGSLGFLGLPWACLGLPSGCLVAVLGLSWACLGLLSWGSLGVPEAPLRFPGAVRGLSWAFPVLVLFACLGPVLVLCAVLGCPELILGCLGLPLDL